MTSPHWSYVIFCDDEEVDLGRCVCTNCWEHTAPNSGFCTEHLAELRDDGVDSRS